MDLILTIIIASTIILTIILLVSVYYLCIYLGYLQDITAKIYPINPFKSITIKGKIHQGNYADCGEFYTDILNAYPGKSSIGYYFDDPNKVEAEKCRYLVGVVEEVVMRSDKLDDSDLQGQPDESLKLLQDSAKKCLDQESYKSFTFVFNSPSIQSSISYNDSLSILILIKKVYSEFQNMLITNLKYSQWNGSVEIYPSGVNRIIIFGDLSGEKGRLECQEILGNSEIFVHETDKTKNKKESAVKKTYNGYVFFYRICFF